MYHILKFIPAIAVFISFSCGNNSEETKNPVDTSKLKKSLENTNKKLNQIEEEEIDSYIQRHDLNMNRTKTGLRYLIYFKGQGRAVEEGKSVSLKYKVTLINGVEIYSSEKDGNKEFVVGYGNVEAGLDEGVRLLRTGDKAKFIIPSYLAYGLMGDDKNIPKRATLIYDVEVAEVW